MSVIDIRILRGGTHGIPTADYATELRDGLPNHEIEVTRTPRE